METDSSALTDMLRSFSLAKGADLFGVADLAPARAEILRQGGAEIAKYPRAVSLGIKLSDAVLDGHDPNQSQRDSLYWHHVYNVVTVSLDLLANAVARRLDEEGFASFAIPGSMPYNLGRLEGLISHKLAAHLAGLGWIGKSSLLLTERFGPRVRFVTVLTDAPLETGSPIDRGCGNCRVCVDTCPVGAFTGLPFSADEPVSARFDAPRCSEFRKTHACGLCVSSCPRGKGKSRTPKGE